MPPYTNSLFCNTIQSNQSNKLTVLSLPYLLSFKFCLQSIKFVNMKTITGTEAIERMREIRHDESKHFALQFITCDLNRNEYGELRILNKVKVRASLPNETFENDTDHYLPIYDLFEHQNKMCFKKLIRQVAFLPDMEWLKVNWFTD
jgi:hypothetical protein